MKTRSQLMRVMLLLIAAVFFVGCGDDDDASAVYNSGTWYLVTYNGNRSTTGEYMRFSGNKVYWNNRLGGENTTYTVTVSGNTFHLSGADGSETFYVTSYTENAMATTSTDDIVRVWKR